MILCKSCGFGVSETMRYALKSNACPSCGKTLFGDSHVQEMTSISRSIRSQSFSQSISDDIIFDISLFILNNYLSLNDPASNETSSSDDLGKDEQNISENEISEEAIREKVRSEVISEIGDINDEAVSKNETEDMRLSRLKRMAKMSKGLNKTGASVRRIST